MVGFSSIVPSYKEVVVAGGIRVVGGPNATKQQPTPTPSINFSPTPSLPSPALLHQLAPEPTNLSLLSSSHVMNSTPPPPPLPTSPRPAAFTYPLLPFPEHCHTSSGRSGLMSPLSTVRTPEVLAFEKTTCWPAVPVNGFKVPQPCILRSTTTRLMTPRDLTVYPSFPSSPPSISPCQRCQSAPQTDWEAVSTVVCGVSEEVYDASVIHFYTCYNLLKEMTENCNIELAPGFTFLDIACAPGGFSQFLLDLHSPAVDRSPLFYPPPPNKSVYVSDLSARHVLSSPSEAPLLCNASSSPTPSPSPSPCTPSTSISCSSTICYGVTLPTQKGGFPVLLDISRSYKTYRLTYYDLLSPPEIGVPHIPELVELCVSDAQYLPNNKFSSTPYFGSELPNRQVAKLALYVSQIRIGLASLKSGGYFILRCTAVEKMNSGLFKLLLVLLDMFERTEAFKSEYVHQTDYSFYLVCSRFNRDKFFHHNLLTHLTEAYELCHAYSDITPNDARIESSGTQRPKEVSKADRANAPPAPPPPPAIPFDLSPPGSSRSAFWSRLEVPHIVEQHDLPILCTFYKTLSEAKRTDYLGKISSMFDYVWRMVAIGESNASYMKMVQAGSSCTAPTSPLSSVPELLARTGRVVGKRAPRHGGQQRQRITVSSSRARIEKSGDAVDDMSFSWRRGEQSKKETSVLETSDHPSYAGSIPLATSRQSYTTSTPLLCPPGVFVGREVNSYCYAHNVRGSNCFYSSTYHISSTPQVATGAPQLPPSPCRLSPGNSPRPRSLAAWWPTSDFPTNTNVYSRSLERYKHWEDWSEPPEDWAEVK